MALRFRMTRGFGGFAIRHHGIAQLFQFQVGNAVAVHPVLENGERYDMRRFVIPVSGQGRAALLERCENGLRSFF